MSANSSANVEGSASSNSSASSSLAPRHALSVVAGTFDYLHVGHYALFVESFQHGRRVEIWLTGDAMAHAKALTLKQTIKSFASRAANVKQWLDAQTPSSLVRFTGEASSPGVTAPEPQVWFDEEFSPDAASFPFRGRYSLHELLDPIGPAATDPRYTCIICSKETRVGCEAINARRVAAGIPPMEVVTVPLYLRGDGTKESSTALRKEAEKEGK